ncbi:MAG: hypothetical protein JXQ23_10805 [Clostridia bacterium]|nr:hypothetical protein [Clostridia bacterium]
MKNKLTVLLFILLITGSLLANIVLQDSAVSYSERRKLIQFNDVEYDLQFSENFEKYALDQFFLRDYFRKLKGLTDLHIFGKTDNNGLYMTEHNVFKLEYPLNSESVDGMSEKINKIYELYLEGHKVYYSIIPDKNYFIKDSRFLTMDYDQMFKRLRENITGDISYISIFDSLTLDDYYFTDHHWKQSHLNKVIDQLGQFMEFENDFDLNDFEEKSYFPFYGAYYGQASINMNPDTLVYLDNDDISHLKISLVEDFTDKVIMEGIYDESALGGIDSYDLFLYGSKPIVIIENDKAKTDRELIVFKDSFANSLVPLLASTYSRITLIDLRLVNHRVLDQFIDFDNQEVLFLYSTLIVNHSEILK